jgi:hypothetical protein
MAMSDDGEIVTVVAPSFRLPTKKTLDLVRLETQALEDDTHANMQGMSDPASEHSFVLCGIKVIHINGQAAHDNLDLGGSEIVNCARGGATINREADVGVVANKTEKALNNTQPSAGNVHGWIGLAGSKEDVLAVVTILLLKGTDVVPYTTLSM